MAKSQQSFAKRQREKNRMKKKQEKLERRARRKAEKEERGPLSFEDMLGYVDENGNPVARADADEEQEEPTTPGPRTPPRE